MLDKLRHGDPVTLWVLGVLAVLVIAGVASGYFKARKIQPNGFKWKQFGFEAMVAVVTGLLTGYVFIALKFVLDFMHPTTIDAAPASGWRIAAEYVAFFFLFDTWFYWLHRWMHKEPMYKLIHKLHHKSTSPNLLTTFSVNPLESLVNGGFLYVFTFVATVVGVPIHQSTMPLLAATTILMGLHVHLGYEFLPRWWNKTWATKWFITATFHDQHHKYFNYNYGGFTTIWDYLCGTVRKKYEADFDKVKARPIRAPKAETEVSAVPAE